ncbi:MAG: hypothetical protein A2X25_14895 [Chloroflexi bacterium GWB2_49_20]|nr:MAG: hypothetical protein A2X25_14895 [Chloroflexi bacterium GWB2_49_20]OGN77411.1 MAG: hypothetical protein A2X26_07790 [Chloroflexi bacterium GWC2_49_37]OGN84246.1 MAG: hypothetical protein A2X27_12440 [Chloroflexi bacterium GWD2_49_16]HCM96254.1 hypothetical protein [Anaerolineae bacterium]
MIACEKFFYDYNRNISKDYGVEAHPDLPLNYRNDIYSIYKYFINICQYPLTYPIKTSIIVFSTRTV